MGKHNRLTEAEGTSFSSPWLTGVAACVMQMHPVWTVRQVYHEIQKSAHLYPYFDYAHGHGIPQAAYFLPPTPSDAAMDSLATNPPKTFDFIYHAESDTYRHQFCEIVPIDEAEVWEPLETAWTYVN